MRTFWIFLAAIIGYCGCAARLNAPDSASGKPASDTAGNSGGADGTLVVPMPFPRGRVAQCTQGPGGSYSHGYASTRFALDLDTSNAFDEEVYAPAAGTAYVHAGNPNGGFGIHVNVDIGDGSYLVFGHMKKALVRDGAPVAPGTLIGVEGCTGSCTGDHLHFDRHEGNAALPAEVGKSVPMSVVAEDVDGAPGFVPRAVDAFVCGLQGGHRYRSDLAVACAHPDGTLVKTPMDPRVYRIDGGTLRWIVNEEIFYGYGYDFRDVIVISEEEYATYAQNADIALPGMVDAAYDPDWQLWLFVGHSSRADRYRIRVQDANVFEILQSWGIFHTPQDEPRVIGFNDPLMLDWPTRAGAATFRDGTLLKAEDRPEVHVVSGGAALPVESWETFLLLGYDPDRIIAIRPGTLMGHFSAVGSCDGQGNVCLSSVRATECAPMEFGVPVESAVWEDVDDDPFELHDLFPLDGGELAVVYSSPAGTDNAPMLFYASLMRGDTAAIPWTVMATGNGYAPLVVRDLHPIPGDRFRFIVYRTEGGANASSCEGGETRGEFFAFLGGEGELEVQTVSDGQDGCLHEIVIPTMAEYEGEEDDPVVEDTSQDSPSDGASGTLAVSWAMPFGDLAERITLSGEYLFGNGSYGFAWHEIKTVHDASGIAHAIADAGSGDSFRFSVEFERTDGSVSWSCIGPFAEGTAAQGTLQGDPSAEFGGNAVPIQTVGDPSDETTGCGLLVEVP